jgi:hypothetical protein
MRSMRTVLDQWTAAGDAWHPAAPTEIWRIQAMTEKELTELAENMEWVATLQRCDGFKESADNHVKAARVIRAMAALTGALRNDYGKWVVKRDGPSIVLDHEYIFGSDTLLEAIEAWAEARR